MLEGPHLVEAWTRHRGEIACLIVAESAQQRSEIATLLERSSFATVVVADPVMRTIAEASTPQGIAAEVRIPVHDAPLAHCASCVFLDGVQDAGNIGAILRSAAAFGLLDVVLGPGCADAWSPKVLRAAAGSHAVTRLRKTNDLGRAIEDFGGRVFWTTPRGGTLLADADLAGRTGWIFGSEGHGVAPDLARRAAGAVSIPVSDDAESLNVAAAAAICFHEFARRRRGPQ